MTLDELENIAHDAMMNEPHADLAFRRGVLAVLAEVRKVVPDYRIGGTMEIVGWQRCCAEMLRRLDEMAK